jgi:peptidoglycan/LPS O-acetylase OafA/YrhL
VPIDHAAYQARRRFPVLDGLRAISILLVVTSHPAYPHEWPALHGSAGVSIFFVLSGYLITTLLLREQQRQGRVSLAAFYIRRLFRIYPLFYLVLLGYVVLIFGLGQQSDRRHVFGANLAYYVFFLPEHALFFNHSGQTVPYDGAWSLGIEEKFYLVWPVLGFLLLAYRKRARLGSLVVAFLGFSIAGWIGGEWGWCLSSYALIAVGCALAVALHDPASYAWLARFGRPRVLLALAIATVAVQFGTNAIILGHFLYTVYALLIAALMAGLLTTTSRGTGWLTSRPMVRLAELSYALYLIHNFGLNFAEKIVPKGHGFAGSLASTVLGLAGALVACEIVHRIFEKPLTDYGHRLSRKILARRAPEPKIPSTV